MSDDSTEDANERRNGWLTLAVVVLIALALFGLIWLAQILFFHMTDADPLQGID